MSEGRAVRWGAGMDIQDMRIFARVAAVQNLSAVGTELGLTPARSRSASRRSRTSFPRACSTAPRAPSASPRKARLSSPTWSASSPRSRRPAPASTTGQQAQGQAQDRGACLPRPPLRGAGACASSCAHVPRDRGAARPAGPPRQPAGGRLRPRHPHRRAVGFFADRQAPGARPPRDRRLAGLSGPRGLARCAPEDLASHSCLVLGEHWQWSFEQGRRRERRCASMAR